ncbi:DNA ligase/mRNA capping enzyme [Hortaea werneckii]|nr:DNA ligase/mRNA capping enzyme [Hortaea werneckii]KAI7593936.1 DNA ligase/mRNA capping enzyme [Hortaea werneckii]
MLFSRVSTLLSRLEDIQTHGKPFLPAAKTEAVRNEIERWFKSNRPAINELGVRGGVALLSSLLPETRTDRVYGIQSASLCRIISRSLSLGAQRAKDLQSYRDPGHGDLGRCTQRVLEGGGPPAVPALTVQELDEVFLKLAEQCRFSDPAITTRPPSGSSRDRDEVIGDVLKRMQPLEAKWFIRILLKDLAPVTVDEKAVLRSFHFLLPDLLRFQNNYEAALCLLYEPQFRSIPSQPDRRSEDGYRANVSSMIKPVVGVKVGRPDFCKSWSIEHCLNMMGPRQWVLERKYDGEYCEVHIDQSLSCDPMKCIKIFSKSGKDSTQDRRKLHHTLVECLRLGQPDCKIKQHAILLGEMVVYSDKDRCVLPFDKIRKHVLRSGVSLGTEADSQAHSYEHLAIVFFDLLLLDDEVVLSRPIEERRQWLREVYDKIPARAFSSEWKIVDFSEGRRAKIMLMQQFAASIAQRCEGLVLKPCHMPYFSLSPNRSGGTCAYIKMKKDYMVGLGDDADFAVIGASHNAQRAASAGTAGIKWTDFHLGCLLNRQEVVRFDAKPIYRLVHTITSESCIPRPTLKTLNILGAYSATPYRAFGGFDVQLTGHVDIGVAFTQPFVVELLGSGFEKPANCSFYMLRHARVKKLHQDRSWKDCISFEELQEKATNARNRPSQSESQETSDWLSRLESKLKLRLHRKGTLSPKSRRTKMPCAMRCPTAPSPCLPSSRVRHSEAVRREDPPKPDSENEGGDPFDGSTLVDDSEQQPVPLRKRPGPATLSPSKRQCVLGVQEPQTSMPRHSEPRVIGKPLPLADITNQVVSHLRDQNDTTEKVGSGRRASTSKQRFNVDSTCPALLPTPPSSGSCSGPKCLFASAAFYLAPCVASMPYITENLLGAHNDVHLAPSLSDWDRDSFAHPPSTETVSESQSYAGLVKIVLVEPNRVAATRGVLCELVGLNSGRLRERIDVYDWRVLEDFPGHDMNDEHLERYYIGATAFDHSSGRSFFETKIPHFLL